MANRAVLTDPAEADSRARRPPFGWDAGVDLYDGDPAKMKDKTKVAAFLADLVGQINMNAYGDPVLVRFGKGALHGLTGVQLIETSDITFHEAGGCAYITVFSCKRFDPDVAADVAVKHFGGWADVQVRVRGGLVFPRGNGGQS